MILYMDIETLPCSDPEFIAEVAASITAPAQYKKPESITEWMEANKEQAIKDAVSKTSFDGMYGSIACISYAFDDSAVFSVDSRQGEKEMLEYFYAHVFDQTMTPHHTGLATLQTTICGHNVHAFDLPFLKHRSIILNVKPPEAMYRAMNAKPWDACIADTLLMWSSDPHKRGSMNRICKALGIPGKDGFDGSMVAETWPIDPDKVIAYCEDDVIRTRAIYKRLTFQQ